MGANKPFSSVMQHRVSAHEETSLKVPTRALLRVMLKFLGKDETRFLIISVYVTINPLCSDLCKDA